MRRRILNQTKEAHKYLTTWFKSHNLYDEVAEEDINALYNAFVRHQLAVCNVVVDHDEFEAPNEVEGIDLVGATPAIDVLTASSFKVYDIIEEFYLTGTIIPKILFCLRSSGFPVLADDFAGAMGNGELVKELESGILANDADIYLSEEEVEELEKDEQELQELINKSYEDYLGE